ncbi:MAG: DUF3899 domain-containing protein [Bacilli bacterium]
MKKLINKFRADLLTNIILLLAGLAVGVAFFFLYIYVFYHSPSFNLMSDATFILAAIFLSVGGLLAVSHIGFFDTIGYGFAKMGNIFFRPLKMEKKYNDLIDYKEQKYEKRKDHGFYYLPFLLLGLLFLIAAIVFYFLYLNAIG